MSEGEGKPLWDDAVEAAAIFCVDPAGVGGVAVRAGPGPVRDRWLEMVRASFPAPSAIRRVPVNVSDDRLLGGLDLTASLRAGRPVADAGLLAEADGGAVILSMAERLDPAAAARLTAVIDFGEVCLQRDGLALRTPSRFGVVALDEGIDDDERPPSTLLDRLGIHLNLSKLGFRDIGGSGRSRSRIVAARRALAKVADPPDLAETLCRVAARFGIESVRAVLFALRTARASAALAGREALANEDIERAARLVLGPRALSLAEEPPAEAETDETRFEPPGEERPPSSEGDDSEGDDSRSLELPLEEIVVAACRAALPDQLLKPETRGAAVRAGSRSRARSRTPGRKAPGSVERGRPTGVYAGAPRPGLRINLIETLRAAAPFQRMRRRDSRPGGEGGEGGEGGGAAIRVAPEDLRVTRRKPHAVNTTILVVDASGSSALHRLGEAKGAVELLLAESYIRRDRVALIAFRQTSAETVLPPTRSLARAKRVLAGLPGGGGTPLAAGIDAAVALSDSVARKGESPLTVLLTDGRANVALDGAAGRVRARADALAAARRLRAAGYSAAFVDTSPRPGKDAVRLAGEMGARYVVLPHVDARNLVGTVQQLAAGAA